MARTKQKDTIEMPFQPTRVDKHAVEISEGKVKIDGLDTIIPKEEYLRQKELELAFSRRKAQEGYQEIKGRILNALPLRTCQFQEECRKLSWAYQSQSNHTHLKKLLTICPDMALVNENKGVVAAHHISHFIRAYLAIVLNLTPLEEGNAPNIVTLAQDEETKVANQIVCWEYLLSIDTPSNLSPKPKGESPIQKVLNQQAIILEKLTKLEEFLYANIPRPKD